MSLKLPVQTARWLRHLGVPGVLALGLLALGLALYGAMLQPTRQRVLLAQQQLASLPERMARAGHELARTPTQQLNTFYRAFPNEKTAPDWIGKIADIAHQNKLLLTQGEYVASRDPSSRLVRLQMTLPLHGSYPQIRQFLAAIQTQLPTVALEQVGFERQKIGDPLVDAKVRLVLFMVRAS
jgi:Tfp pilus assembly protein PilO